MQDDVEFAWAGERARHVGTVVHRWLQVIAVDAAREWNAGPSRHSRARFALNWHELGVPQADAAHAAERVIAAMARTLGDERGRWLLGERGRGAVRAPAHRRA